MNIKTHVEEINLVVNRNVKGLYSWQMYDKQRLHHYTSMYVLMLEGLQSQSLGLHLISSSWATGTFTQYQYLRKKYHTA